MMIGTTVAVIPAKHVLQEAECPSVLTKHWETYQPIFQCTVNGCQSRVPLEDELLAKLKAGQGGVVAFRDGQGRNVPLAFSLRGFTAGFAAVQ